MPKKCLKSTANAFVLSPDIKVPFSVISDVYGNRWNWDGGLLDFLKTCNALPTREGIFIPLSMIDFSGADTKDPIVLIYDSYSQELPENFLKNVLGDLRRKRSKAFTSVHVLKNSESVDFVSAANCERVVKLDIWENLDYESEKDLYFFDRTLWVLKPSDKAYDPEQLRLVFLDEIDKERRKFERLKRKFDGLAGERSERRREPIPEEVRIFVWRRDQGKCVKCGSQENIEFDHVIPVSKGGSSTERNIQLLCERCNREKKDKI